MVSIMNGLSAMGAGIAQFAGTAGLEAQKAQLQQQGMVLADQLAHTSKTAEIEQQGGIAATAAQALAGTQMQQLQVSTASAQAVADKEAAGRIAAAQAEAGGMVTAETIRSAASRANLTDTLAANAPLLAEQVHKAQVEGGLQADQLKIADQSTKMTLDLAAELSKPPQQQDQGKISSIMQERQGLMAGSPDLMKSQLEAVSNLTRAQQQEVTNTASDIARFTAQLSNPMLAPADKATVQANVDALQRQQDDNLGRLRSLILMGQSYLHPLSSQTGGQATPTPAGNQQLDLSKFLKPSSATPTPAAGPAAMPMPGTGMINSQAPMGNVGP